MLYCALTGQLMDKSVDAVKLHMKGRKWKLAKGKHSGTPYDGEPNGLWPAQLKGTTPCTDPDCQPKAAGRQQRTYRPGTRGEGNSGPCLLNLLL